VNKMKMKGKIIYTPPERCYANVNIEETPHGYRLYREGESQPFMSLPFSCVKAVEYKKE